MKTTKGLGLSDIEIFSVETNRLFFDKYQYNARFNLSEITALRGLNIEQLDRTVKQRNLWRQHDLQWHGRTGRIKYEITPVDVERLRTLGNLLTSVKDKIKFVVSYDRGYVYANDIDILKTIQDIDFLDNFQIYRAVVTGPRDTILLKNPRWSQRTYFRSLKLTDLEKKTLIDYLKSRENIRMSPGLIYWILASSHRATWTQRHFFIDHNDDGELLFLNMVRPNISRCTMQIIAK